MIGRYRQDQGKKADKFQFASQDDTGHNSHDRKHAGSVEKVVDDLGLSWIKTSSWRRGPEKPFKFEDVFKHVEICIPEPVECVEVVICDPVDKHVESVPDASGTLAMLGLGLFALISLGRRFLK